MTPVIARGFLGRTLVFEENVNETDMEAIVEKHIEKYTAGEVDMFELEFPDAPEEQRFVRFGSNPARMVMPLVIKL